jgi:hypothetical protein
MNNANQLLTMNNANKLSHISNAIIFTTIITTTIV